MIRRLIVLWALFCLCGLTAWALAGDAGAGPETMTLDINGKGKSVKDFSHRKHQQLVKNDCKTCHHDFKPGTPVKKCSGCHADMLKKDEKTKAIGFKDATHKTCIDCHKKAADKPDLKKCTACHPK